MTYHKKYLLLIFLVFIFIISNFIIGDPSRFILMEIRLPRFIMLAFVGIALSLSGFLLQIITQNPLSDPGILGINQGAGLAITVLYLFFPLSQDRFQWQVPLCAILGGTLSVIILIILSSRGHLSIQKLILNGIGLNAIMSGLITLLIARSKDPIKIEFMAKWMNGSLWSYNNSSILFLSIIVISMMIFLYYLHQKIDYFILPTYSQKIIGFEYRKYQIILLIISIILATSAVAFSGGIAFIGLIVPSLTRRLFKNKYSSHWLIVAIIGMLMIWFTDSIIQNFSLNVPLGSLIALFGAPYFLFLIVKNK